MNQSSIKMRFPFCWSCQIHFNGDEREKEEKHVFSHEIMSIHAAQRVDGKAKHLWGCVVTTMLSSTVNRGVNGLEWKMTDDEKNRTK